MNRRQAVLSVAAALGAQAASAGARADGGTVPGRAAVRPEALCIDHRPTPAGLAGPRPRFGWTLGAVDPAQQGLRQSAARVAVSGPDGGSLFDSGRVAGSAMCLVPRRDLALPPQTPLTWRVMVWDQDGRASPWSAPAGLVTGVATEDRTAWRGAWIAAEADGPITAPSLEASPPATSRYALPLLRRRFRVERPVRHAVVCLSGLGVHALTVNGQVPSPFVMNPGWTDYRKTVPYETIDVTAQLRPGDNMLGVRLGSGLYDVQRQAGRYTKFVGSYGAPKLILQLRIVHDDGSERWVLSDGAWHTHAGPTLFSSVYGGEDEDAQREPPGWDRPDAADGPGWSPALLTTGPGGTLRAQATPGLFVAETLAAVAVSRPAPGIVVHDLGRNIAGRPRLTLRGASGDTVRATPGELLDGHGRVTQASMGARPDAAIRYSLTLGERQPGDARETVWAPRFGYTGFRYLEVEGEAAVAAGADVVRADLPVNSSFDSDSPAFNAVHRLIRGAVLSNVATVLTDCPHREKLGWLEQTWLNAGTVLRTVDALPLYAKTIDDMCDAQRADGMVPSIAPEYIRFVDASGADTPFRHSPEWGSAIVQAPWAVYRHSGDAAFLQRAYPAMCRYMAFLERQAQGGLLDVGLGDWYDLGPKPPGEAQLTSRAYTGSAVWYDDLRVLARIARLLGRPAEAVAHARRAARLRTAIQRRWFDAASGRYDRGSQTAQAMALVLDLPPPAARPRVRDRLLDALAERGDHVSAGDVGFHYLVRALGRDAPERLAALIRAPDAPSYAAQLARGATTLTEAWDANPASSQNHFMLGHAMEWLHAVLGGIDLDFARGPDAALRIAPCPVSGVSSVSVTLRCTLGEVQSRWRRDGARLHLRLSVPAGAAATVLLPGAAPRRVGSGDYDF